MNRGQRAQVGGGGRHGLDVGDEVGAAFFAGLGEVDLVAHPVDLPLPRVACLGVVGRLDRFGGGPHLLGLPQSRPAARFLRWVVLLRPHPPEHVHGLQLVQPCGRVFGLHRAQEIEAVGADLFGQLLSLGVAPGQPKLLHARTVAFEPFVRRPAPEPPRGDGCQHVQRGPQRLAYALQPAHRLDRREHVGRIRALLAPGLEKPPILALRQQLLEEQVLDAPGQHPGAELAQNREVEAGILQLQAQRVLPIYARAHGVGRLPVREPLGELHHGHQNQPPRRQGRLPAFREEAAKVFVLPDDPELVPHPGVGGPLRERGPGDADGSFGDGADRLGT